MTLIVPVRDLTTREILYGSRDTSFRYELLTHDTVTGLDSLLGVLDGVTEDAGVEWSASARVKKKADIPVRDLAVAQPGMLRYADIDPVTVRIRPVMVIDGLPEIPLGLYVTTGAPDEWDGTGRTIPLSLLDKSTVLDQDCVEETFTAGTSATVLEIVKQLVESAGETINPNMSDTRTLANPRVWDAGTPKLTIINDLLNVLQYQALWVDGSGNFQATPYTRPADRPIRYAMLNDDDGAALVRELSDGEQSIYLPEWSRERNLFGVPNKVVAVAQGTGDDEPLSGSATNEDPESPFSYQSRGRWIVHVLDGVDVPDLANDTAVVAYLNEKANQTLVAMSSVQAGVSVDCLPIPVELLEAVRFASTPAGINARHTVQKVQLELKPDGLMSLELLEVVDL